MTTTTPSKPDSRGALARVAGATRKARSIRFSDSEWEEVKVAAERRGIPVAEFVREKLREVARGNAVDSAATVAALAPLIERTFRYTWMLATHTRDEMTKDGRADEIKKLVEQARELQDRLQETDHH